MIHYFLNNFLNIFNIIIFSLKKKYKLKLNFYSEKLNEFIIS